MRFAGTIRPATGTPHDATYSGPILGFRPVLEVLNPGTLGSDGLKVVTLDLGGGKLGNSSEDIQIIVKTGSTFTAPASGGLTRPDGNTGSYFMWLGSDGKLYAPGANVPAEVTKLTAQFALSEQFSLTPGGTYYFDLSGAGIPGTVNGNLPDSTLHYVPFTYAGTVDAYKLTSAMATTEEYAQQNKYAHSLFVADYAVTHTVSWDDLNTKGLIFGKNYAGGGVGYTLRAPSVGSSYTGSDDSERGTPKSNEWDKILDKDDGYIKNWREMLSCGQDTTIRISASFRAVRGWKRSARFWTSYNTSYSTFGFRPVLEVLNPDTLGSDGMKVVTLDLGGGKLGGSSDAIHIIVKNGGEFTAPASGGLTRPDGNTGSYFMWLDGNGTSYAPGASVPADVTELTVQWTAPTYTVTLHTNGGTINNGNVTEYTYGVGATLPTDVTRTGYTFKGWYDNEGLTGSPVTAISNTETGNKEYWAKWEINQYTITYDLGGGTVEGNPDTYTVEMDTFTLKNPTRPGYTFTGWSGTGLDGENNMTVTIPKGSTGERRYTAHWRYNGGSSGGSSSYPITVPSKTENGTVTVSPKSASAGSTVTITVKPDSGYVLETISVTDKNGNDLKLTDKGGGKYTFTMPASKVEVKATFMEDNSVLNFFYDVPNDAYYYEAIKWAAENGVTGGVGNSLFAPNQPCTRAQIVTFLWRAAGSPVVNYLMPFTDVDEGAYYAEAVRWAASTGIVTGLTETTFGTDSVCTRAQAAAMIYRCAQAQGKGFTGAWMFHLPFTDVPEWAYESVAWCYMNGVTTGVSETSFAPGNDCTRAQIVTFLWRAFSK
ncbi:S-layer homology domain-containing protein [Oscillospiraceae bacterium HCN-4035]